MQTDLVNPTTISTLARRVLIVASIILAVGLTGVVFARADQQKPRIVWVGRGGAMTVATSAKPHAAVVEPSPFNKRVILMEVTAYCPCPKCCGPDAQGITASGKDVSYNDGRFVAADTHVLPFGTRLQVPGYGDAQPVEVIDRGGAIKGQKLDVFFPTHEAALKWGRQKLEVTVEE